MGNECVKKDPQRYHLTTPAVIGNRINTKATIESCTKEGIKQFNRDEYIKCETLERMSYWEVYKVKEKNSNRMVAIKGTKYENNLEDPGTVLANFLKEKSIFEKLSELTEYPEFLPKYYGSFYELNKLGEVENLIVITEVWDFSLEEIVNARKNSVPKAYPYTPKEVLSFLGYIVKGFELLKKLRIYHSNVTLRNIVYSAHSAEKGKFMLVNFISSSVIPDETNEVDMNKYVVGGTYNYSSPEKKPLWMITENIINEIKINMFNPFKCDCWSLGICLQRMIKDSIEDNEEPERLNTKETKGEQEQEEKMGDILEITYDKKGTYTDDKDLNEILLKMLQEDWQKRIDAQELKDLLIEKNIVVAVNFYQTEYKYFEICQNKRFEEEEFKNIFQNYKDAEEIEQMKKVALKEFELKIKSEEYLYSSEIFKRLAEVYQLEGDFKKFNDCTYISMKNSEINKILEEFYQNNGFNKTTSKIRKKIK